jgi:hypothetical protein
MEFTLVYKGKVNDGKVDKKKRIEVIHEIRLNFHQQLKALIKLPPLNDHQNWFNKLSYPKELHKSVDGKDFISLVSSDLKMYVDLRIDLFSAYKNRSFKDIDNKLKIICDALQVPREKKNIPLQWVQNSKTERPLICLLSDDKLIYKLNVDTDYILKNDFFEKDEMLCIIKVKIKGNKYHTDFIDLII